MTAAPAPGRSRACANETHETCGHVTAAIPGARRRSATTILLCRCSCHRACPLARRKEAVAVTAWRQRCSCPGAEQARHGQGDPGESLPSLEDWWETTYDSESRQRSEARKEAFNAARAVASGKTRDEIRVRFAAELRARGLEVPADRLLEVAVDVLSGEPRTVLGKLLKTVHRTFADG
jgi:hypothetical protein